MKGILSILTISFLVSLPIQAQFKIGARGGINISKVYLDEKIIGEGNITGFQVGPAIELMPHLPIGFDAAVLYSRYGLSIIDAYGNTFEESTDYIDVPVNLKFKIGISAVKLYLTAGPYIGFKISGDNTINGIYEQAVQQWEAQTFQAGINVGGGIEVVRSIQIGANYEVGLTDNYSNNDFEAKNRTLSITATVFF